jgi:hypothetical protein
MGRDLIDLKIHAPGHPFQGTFQQALEKMTERFNCCPLPANGEVIDRIDKSLIIFLDGREVLC